MQDCFMSHCFAKSMEIFLLNTPSYSVLFRALYVRYIQVNIHLIQSSRFVSFFFLLCLRNYSEVKMVGFWSGPLRE